MRRLRFALAAVVVLAALTFVFPANVAAHGASDYSVWCRYPTIYYNNVGGKFYARDVRTNSQIHLYYWEYRYDHQTLTQFGPWEWWSYAHSYTCRNYSDKGPL